MMKARITKAHYQVVYRDRFDHKRTVEASYADLERVKRHAKAYGATWEVASVHKVTVYELEVREEICLT